MSKYTKSKVSHCLQTMDLKGFKKEDNQNICCLGLVTSQNLALMIGPKNNKGIYFSSVNGKSSCFVLEIEDHKEENNNSLDEGVDCNPNEIYLDKISYSRNRPNMNKRKK